MKGHKKNSLITNKGFLKQRKRHFLFKHTAFLHKVKWMIVRCECKCEKKTTFIKQ